MTATFAETRPVGHAQGEGVRTESGTAGVSPVKHSQLFLESIGKRVYTDGMSKNFVQSWHSFLIAVVTLGIYLGWIYILYAITIAALFNRYVAAALGLLALTVALPGKLYWQEFLDNYVFRTWREYFKFSFVFEEPLDFNRNYVFAEYPHGLFPMSQFLAATIGSQAWPGHRIYSIAADIVFMVPMWRHVMLWLGSQPATAQNFARLLKRGSVAVIAGGVAEMYMQHATQEQILLKKRKGFIKVAIENGVDIVPVYHFGNTQLFTGGPNWLVNYSRKMRMFLGYAYGRWGLPVPRQHELLMVCGRPIAVTPMRRTDEQFEPEVDRVSAAVVQEMERLYDAWKGEYGWQDRPLVLF